MNKVAAIVSAYYASIYIKGRVDDLLSQSINPLVVVVAQRNSLEAQAVTQLHGSNRQVQLVLTEDIPTVYEAWNIGIKSCESEYVTNANSDDRLYPDALKIMSKMLDKNKDQALVYTDVDRVRSIGGTPEGQFVWAEGGLAELLNGCFIGPMPMWRRSVHAKHGYFNPEYKSAGDYEFWMRLAHGGEKFKHIHSVLGAHLERPDALEHRSPVRTVWEIARARSLYRGAV